MSANKKRNPFQGETQHSDPSIDPLQSAGTAYPEKMGLRQDHATFVPNGRKYLALETFQDASMPAQPFRLAVPGQLPPNVPKTVAILSHGLFFIRLI